MAAAIPVAAAGFALARHRRAPLAAAAFQGPTATAIDRRLVLGAVIFGTGWGLVGYCPGPALAALGLGAAGTWLFVLAMLAGMALSQVTGWGSSGARPVRTAPPAGPSGFGGRP